MLLLSVLSWRVSETWNPPRFQQFQYLGPGDVPWMQRLSSPLRETRFCEQECISNKQSYFTRGGTNRGILVTTRNTLGWGKNVLTKFTISEVVLTWVYRGV